MSTYTFLEAVMAYGAVLVFCAWLIGGALSLPYLAWFWWSRREYRRTIHAPMNTALRDYRSAANREKETA